MPVICFQSVKPNNGTVDQLYIANSEAGSIYSGSGAPPLCSSTDLSSPSGCVVCFQQFIYAVCVDLQKNVKLVMEGGGRAIDIIESECPIFSGASKWWLLLLLLVPVIIILLLGAWKYRKHRKYLRVQRAADSRDPNPEADSTV